MADKKTKAETDGKQGPTDGATAKPAGGPAIQIFAVTFGDDISEGDSISTMMANCTTDPLNNYYHAPDTATLEAAFEEIARQLTSLRLID